MCTGSCSDSRTLHLPLCSQEHWPEIKIETREDKKGEKRLNQGGSSE